MTDGEVCFINIGPKERAKRMRFGAVALVVTLAGAAAMMASGISPLWRLVLVLPFMTAATGYFQARDQT
jgi:hypothetical protein